LHSTGQVSFCRLIYVIVSSVNCASVNAEGDAL